MAKKKDNVSNDLNENVKNENELENTPTKEENNAENSQPAETDEKKDNVSNDFKDKIQNTSIDRVRVIAKYNHGSFDKGVEYEISRKTLESYNGIFEIL